MRSKSFKCWVQFTLSLLWVSVVVSCVFAQTWSEEFIRSSVDFCSRYSSPLPSELSVSTHISDDKTILCYDGVIYNQDVPALNELSNGGIFVIRSRGGLPSSAMKLANVLQSKQATVVIHDYCLSACAGFIYVATARTYVMRNSLVAWHAPGYQPPLCDGLVGSAKTIESWTSLSTETRERYCTLWALQASFFKTRGASPNILFSTKSAYVSKQLTRLTDNEKISIGELFWMWHPRYHEDIFTTKVIYELYPRDQYEVSEIARKFGLPRIIYDP
jgi:hypothetical protein